MTDRRLTNTTLGALAPGDVFQFDHDRDGEGPRNVKVDVWTSRGVGSSEPVRNFRSGTTEAEADGRQVTRLGVEADFIEPEEGDRT